MKKLDKKITAIAFSHGEGNIILLIASVDFEKFQSHQDVVCMSCSVIDKEATRTTIQTAMTFNTFDIVEDNDVNKTYKHIIDRKFPDSEIEKINTNLIV